jgi:hypothetical protein
MPTDRDQMLLEHGWRHFEFHAQQRLSLFNFYIVLCGLLVAAWATVMTSDESMREVGILLSVLLSFFSYVFWRFDQRNADLTKQAETVVGLAEERLFGTDSKLFCAEKIDEPLGKARHPIRRHWSHGTSLRVIFIGVGLIGLAGATYSAIGDRARAKQAVSVVGIKTVGKNATAHKPEAPTPAKKRTVTQ